MENGSRTAHGDPRSARTPPREQQASCVSDLFCKTVVCTWYLVPVVHVTGLCMVLASCIPFMGNDPRNYQGRGILPPPPPWPSRPDQRRVPVPDTSCLVHVPGTSCLVPVPGICGILIWSVYCLARGALARSR